MSYYKDYTLDTNPQSLQVTRIMHGIWNLHAFLVLFPAVGYGLVIVLCAPHAWVKG